MSGALEHRPARAGLITLARKMNGSGLNQGTSGNLSQRVEGGFLLTPSGMDYELLLPEDIVFMRLDGTWEGRREPSSEWRIHRDVFVSRPEVAASSMRIRCSARAWRACAGAFPASTTW